MVLRHYPDLPRSESQYASELHACYESASLLCIEDSHPGIEQPLNNEPIRAAQAEGWASPSEAHFHRPLHSPSVAIIFGAGKTTRTE